MREAGGSCWFTSLGPEALSAGVHGDADHQQVPTVLAAPLATLWGSCCAAFVQLQHPHSRAEVSAQLEAACSASLEAPSRVLLSSRAAASAGFGGRSRSPLRPPEVCVIRLCAHQPGVAEEGDRKLRRPQARL